MWRMERAEMTGAIADSNWQAFPFELRLEQNPQMSWGSETESELGAAERLPKRDVSCGRCSVWDQRAYFGLREDITSWLFVIAKLWCVTICPDSRQKVSVAR